MSRRVKITWSPEGVRPVASNGSPMGRRHQQQPLEHRLLLTATFCLLAAGAVMVYSASSARTLLQGQGDGTAYLLKYVGYGSVGLIGMYLVSRLNLEHIRRYTGLLLGLAFVLLLLVKVPGVGVRVNGAHRWLGFGPLQFQPSEIMKIALVMHISAVIATRPKIAREIRLLVGPVIGVTAAAVLLIALQPDLGTDLVICATVGMMLVAAGLPMRQLGMGFGVGATLVMLFAIFEPYRRARLTSFLDPWDHASGAGFQAVQGQIAIGSGGLFGHGLGASIQKIFYVPEAHTDFILAVIGEELGLAGILALLSLYGIIGYAGLRTARNAKGLYAKLLAGGLTSLILCQATLNIYAVLGLAPLTGVPLPFISSGSTSLIVMLGTMGLLLNIAGGGSAHLRAVPERKPPRERVPAGGHRGGWDGGTRRTGHSGGRRAAS
jgi:cell division protein FtsW